MIQKQWNLDKTRDVLQLRAIQRRRPLSCTFELTYRCNFRCRMCYIRMDDAQAAPFGRMRTVEEWLDMARQAHAAGVLYLNLTGGECTQYPGFAELYEQLSQMGFRISIMSNAGAYSEAIRQLFTSHPPYGAAITLYGGSNETYAAVTGDPRGFDKTVENIRFFQRIGVPVSLNFTMVRQNALDYLKVGQLCQSLNISYTLLSDVTPHMWDPSFSDAQGSRLSPAERACIACHPPEEAAQALENARTLEKELVNYQPPQPPEVLPEPEIHACVGSYSACAIRWNGDMHYCLSFINGAAKPFEIGFEAAWAQLQEQHREVFQLPAVCQGCALWNTCEHNCAGRHYEGTGDYRKPDPALCQYTYLLSLYRRQRDNVEIPSAPSCAGGA